MSIIVVGLNSLRYLVHPRTAELKQSDRFSFGVFQKFLCRPWGFSLISISTPLYFLTSSTELPKVDKFFFYSQEVHLKKTGGFFHRVHIVLGDDFVTVRPQIEEGCNR